MSHRFSRILLVTRNLPPLVGGMERLNWHMAEELAKVAEVRVVGPQGAAALAPKGVPVREAPLKPLRAFLWHARKLAKREARAWQPDIVLAGSGLTAPLARAAARACGARTAVYVHGLDVAVKHPAYRAFWLPAIRRMDRVIANSRATAELCRNIGVDSARTGIVHPGVDLPSISCRSGPWPRQPQGSSKHPSQPWSAPTNKLESPPKPHDEQERDLSNLPASEGESNGGAEGFRQRHRLGRRTLLLSVGRLSARKGLREFVEQALPRIVSARPDAMLLVIGETPGQALHAEAQSPQSIQTVANARGVGEHVKFLGVITDYAELGAAYHAADAHVFPVRRIPGDPEGFGMVAVEAAAHGLPTVAFATGGVVDAVADGASGLLVPPGDYAGFADAVENVLSSATIESGSCTAFARQFAWPEFGRQLAAQLPLPGP